MQTENKRERNMRRRNIIHKEKVIETTMIDGKNKRKEKRKWKIKDR